MTQKKLPYGYGLSFLTLFKLYLNRANVRKWTVILFTAGLALMPLLIPVVRLYPPGSIHEWIGQFIISLMFFIWGWVGYLWAYRRHAIQLIDLHGKPAVILGIQLMVISWGLALYGLVLGIRSLFSAVAPLMFIK